MSPMKVLFLAAAVTMAAGVPSTWAVPLNLIRDGGFERPAPPLSGAKAFQPGQTFHNWLVTGESGDVAVSSGYHNNFPAWRGKAYMDLTGGCDCGAASGVAQTIATTPGTTYRLTFRVGTGVPSFDDFSSTVNVYDGSTLLIKAVYAVDKDGGDQLWKKFSVSFVATASSTTLNFVSGDPAGDENCGLDGVEVVAET